MTDAAAPLLNYAPSSPEVEMAVLGGLLAHPAAIDVARTIVAQQHFADDRHGRIFEAICALADSGQPANPFTLRAWAERERDLADLGGGAYLAKLASSSLTAVAIRDHARHIVDLYRRRRLIAAAQFAIDQASKADPGQSPAALADQMQAELDAIFDGGADAPIIAAREAVRQAATQAELAAKGQRQTVPTGFRALDQMLGGLEPGGVYVVGGRPGMGKTSLGLWMAYRAARDGHRVMFASLEMADAQLGRRIVAGLAGIPIERLRDGQRMTQADWSALLKVEQQVAKLPLFLDDRAGQTVASIAARARGLARGGRLGMLVIDHLGLIQPPREIARHGPTAAVEHASNALKRIAKDLACPVILLCQLNRAVEGRDDKRPTLADLRQSGAIEQDADAVLFVYREAYYARRDMPRRMTGETATVYGERQAAWRAQMDEIGRDAEVIVAKQRDGALGCVSLAYDEPTATFDDAGDLV